MAPEAKCVDFVPNKDLLMAYYCPGGTARKKKCTKQEGGLGVFRGMPYQEGYGAYPVFRGEPYQQGYGFASMAFRGIGQALGSGIKTAMRGAMRFARRGAIRLAKSGAMRALKKVAVPALKRVAAKVGKRVLKQGTRVLRDVARGKQLKKAIQQRAKQGLKHGLAAMVKKTAQGRGRSRIGRMQRSTITRGDVEEEEEEEARPRRGQKRRLVTNYYADEGPEYAEDEENDEENDDDNDEEEEIAPPPPPLPKRRKRRKVDYGFFSS
jgi:hypothetical protein